MSGSPRVYHSFIHIGHKIYLLNDNNNYIFSFSYICLRSVVVPDSMSTVRCMMTCLSINKACYFPLNGGVTSIGIRIFKFILFCDQVFLVLFFGASLSFIIFAIANNVLTLVATHFYFIVSLG